MRFENITKELEKQIKSITGVIESGLFINYNVEVIKWKIYVTARWNQIQQYKCCSKSVSYTHLDVYKSQAKGQELAQNQLIEKIADYINENIELINDAVELIFIEETAEKNSLYKAIEKNGEVLSFPLLKLPELISNIQKICNAYKVKIDSGTARYFVETCGTNMQDLINEIRKLIEYVGKDGVITKSEIAVSYTHLA